MDFLQIALIFLITLLSVFLSVLGIQVFFILRDLKKALDRLNISLQPTPLKLKSSKPKVRLFKSSR